MPKDPIQEPTPEQREAMDKLIARLPPESDRFADHSYCRRTVATLRSMLDSQGRVSEQHRRRVQELAAENKRLRAALAPIMAYLEAVVSMADPDGTRRTDKLAAANDVWLLRSDIERLRDALPAPRSAEGG